MAWAWEGSWGTDSGGGLQFCWQVGHLLVVVGVVWISVAEVHSGWEYDPEAAVSGMSWDVMILRKGQNPGRGTILQVGGGGGCHSPILACVAWGCLAEVFLWLPFLTVFFAYHL